jgi:nucleoside triphosphatase
MIFLVFSCRAANDEVKLNNEFVEFAWVDKEALRYYDLNSATIETFSHVGVLQKDDRYKR